MSLHSNMVLVVDDDKDFCSLITTVLRKEGWGTECAHTLTESITKLENIQPSLVLLDNNLPDGKGIDFFKAHKTLFQSARVLMVSADPTLRLQEVAVDSGIEQFLGKPLILSEFRAFLHEFKR